MTEPTKLETDLSMAIRLIKELSDQIEELLRQRADNELSSQMDELITQMHILASVLTKWTETQDGILSVEEKVTRLDQRQEDLISTVQRMQGDLSRLVRGLMAPLPQD
ncbi:MAG: hypothetical protein CMF72_09030 [Mameliella sp.]|nr:hypothetical protein [Mameliella sp.]